jgi:RNA polymerase subunit RPABC4/transcription elongation factor Spt4
MKQIRHLHEACAVCGDRRVGQEWYGESDILHEGGEWGGMGVCGDSHQWVPVYPFRIVENNEFWGSYCQCLHCKGHFFGDSQFRYCPRCGKGISCVKARRLGYSHGEWEWMQKNPGKKLPEFPLPAGNVSWVISTEYPADHLHEEHHFALSHNVTIDDLKELAEKIRQCRREWKLTGTQDIILTRRVGHDPSVLVCSVPKRN